MKRVLVCGGRDFNDAEKVGAALDKLSETHGIQLIIHGGARGADWIAHEWALRNRVPVQMYLPDWKQHGKAAGPIRNAKMLAYGRPTLVLAFPGGKGTENMIAQAEAAKVTVERVA